VVRQRDDREPGPDFVVIGYACRDLVDGRHTLGGGVVYAGLTAHRLGQRVGVVTSVGPDLDLKKALPGIEVVARRSSASTIFRNVYTDGARQQFLYSQAEPIVAEDVPPSWLEASIVLLCPLADEVPYGIGRLFRRALVGASVQGWLRAWDGSGRVRAIPWREGTGALVGVHVVVAGEDDLAAEPRGMRALMEPQEASPHPDPLPGGEEIIGVLTQGERGATVFWSGQARRFPAYSAVEVDPTGAGDAFAAAFLLELKRSGDLARAADFANCVASFVVERPGIEGVPTLAEVQRRLGRTWRRVER